MKKGLDFIGICICWFCHDGQGNFVMQKRGSACRDEQGSWDTGGGALEFGDDVEKRLRKEIKEGFGAEVLKSDFLGFRNVFRELDGRKTHWLALDFKVLVDPKKVSNREPHKFYKIDWFTFENLPNPLHS
jgi:8-oxo-dGTP pyrophosphatase MutT (NUDIX family)